MLDDGADRDLAELESVQAVLLDQRPERLDHHAEVADVGVGRVVAAERNAHSAENRHAFDRSHKTPFVKTGS